MIGRHLRPLAIALLLCSAATPASAFKKCRMADGKLVFTDIPPPGCVVEGELANAPHTPAAESAPEDPGATGGTDAASGLEAQAIQGRRRIERDLANAADELAALARESANAPKLPSGVYVNTETGEGSYQSGQNVRPDVAAGLQARENEVKNRIQALRDEHAALTKALEDANGGQLPPWWSREPRCQGCPS